MCSTIQYKFCILKKIEKHLKNKIIKDLVSYHAGKSNDTVLKGTKMIEVEVYCDRNEVIKNVAVNLTVESLFLFYSQPNVNQSKINQFARGQFLA